MTGIPPFLALTISGGFLELTGENYYNTRGRISFDQFHTWERISTPPAATGSSGFCYVEKCIKPEDIYDLRLVKKMPVDDNFEVESVAREVNALLYFAEYFPLRYVQGYCWWHEDPNFFIAMEYCEHGDLTQAIKDLSSADVKSREREVSMIVIQLIIAVHFLHAARYAHRDIKPKNIFITKRDGLRCIVKLGDFGLMKRIDEIQGKPYKKGTLPYIAPELLLSEPKQQLAVSESSNSPFPADMWALGMTIFELLTSHTIFTDDAQGERDILNPSQCQMKLTSAFKELETRGFSEECRTFVSELLTISPEDRLAADEGLNESWVNEYIDVDSGKEYMLDKWDFTHEVDNTKYRPI